jgi:hypothetical protein
MYTNTNAFLKIFILTEINFMTKKIVFPKLSWKFVVTGTLLIHEKINNQMHRHPNKIVHQEPEACLSLGCNYKLNNNHMI